jgi:DNA-binding NarL/FixJ family response regulator
MTTILVIDDDPYTEMIVRAAVPHDWIVRWAPNGLIGLDLLRGQSHTRTDADLVILDINMPGLDGYDTCVRIRQIAPAMRILPFTGVSTSSDLISYLKDFSCAPLLRKGCRIEELARAIRDALMADAPSPVPPSGMLSRLQQHALDREMLARHADTPRIALFAPDPVIRLGLVSLLSGASVCVQGIATSEHALRSLLSATRIQALIAVGQDRARALTIAREFAVPLIVIVATCLEAQMLQDLDVAGVVVSSDGAAVRQMSAAIEAVANGARWWPHMKWLAAAGATFDRAGADLTPQERMLLALDGPGVSPEWLAQALHVSRSTIRQYRYRLRRKLADDGLALS